MEIGGAERRRVFNEDRRRLFGELGREIAFVCECADPLCHATVALTAAGYDGVRAVPPGLLLAAGHHATPPPAAAPPADLPDPNGTTVG